MRFKTIHDFLSLVDKCPFCNNELSVMINKKNNIPKYNAALNQDPHSILYTVAHPEEPSQYNFSDQLHVAAYFSELKENQLSCLSSYDSSEREIKVFSINTHNNQLTYGLTQNVANILVEHDMCLLKHCTSRSCYVNGFNYRYQSSQLVLGTLTRTIYPLIMSTESVAAIIDGQKFNLISSANLPNTYLLDSKGVVATLPKLNLYKMLDKNYLIKKIKTYILFS
ncbi:MAG: hypothetical protein WCT07_03975 [Candidatus Paceibacterota bacterium]|jgi:hypothetical protein